MSQAELKMYTWEEIEKHNSDNDCWVVMYDKVLDVTAWLNEHPGGFDPIRDMAGMDITSSFESIGHTSTALVKSKSLIIGRVDPASKRATSAVAAQAPPPPRWSEMNREELIKYKAGGDIIPLRVIVAVVLALLAIVLYLALR